MKIASEWVLRENLESAVFRILRQKKGAKIETVVPTDHRKDFALLKDSYTVTKYLIIYSYDDEAPIAETDAQ